MNPVPRPRIHAASVDWNKYNEEDTLRLRLGDIGFIHWTQTKHDLLAVKEAADGACMRNFGVVGAPGNDFVAGEFVGSAGTEILNHRDRGFSLPFSTLYIFSTFYSRKACERLAKGKERPGS